MRVDHLVALIMVCLFIGCGQESSPAPTNKPIIQNVGTQALCVEKREPNGKVLVLDKVTITVKDLDGVADILAPNVYIDGVQLEMGAPVKLAAPMPTSEEETPETCLAEDGGCIAQFSWERTTENDDAVGPGFGIDQILCGPGSSGAMAPVLFKPTPFLDVSVMDRMGWMAETSLLVRAAE